MKREVALVLDCCGLIHRLPIDECAILARKPDDLRKNVECANCGKIVILDFGVGRDLTRPLQEVIDLG